MVQPRAMMTPFIPYTAVLTCHPQTPNEAVRRIDANVSWKEAGALAFTYTLKGDLSRLQISSPTSPGRAERLWQHTCFEAFVAVKGEPAYCELNFAPSGEWAAYAFHAYREGGPLEDDELDPTIVVQRAADTLQLNATIRVDRLPIVPASARLRLALCAVIEGDRGKLSYWALKHPPGKPDFHHPGAFALEIEPLDLEAVKARATEAQ
jgi:hypothetical protein